MEIFTFDKSLQERLVEYSEILSSREDVVPASMIKSEWSFHVELVIEPAGWRALWKIPRLTCQDFEIHYPSIVLVEVEQIDFSELSALVRIIAVQDEIHLPEKYDVPLEELYPTLEQDNKLLDVSGTANCIDKLRFFYHHLWMPWDLDDEEDTHWVSRHLEPRLCLFFDIKRGVVDQGTADVVRTLVREGKEIQSRIERLESDMSDEDVDDSQIHEGKACKLMKLHLRMRQIKGEMEIMENPAMREVIRRGDKASSPENKRRESRGRKREAFFVSHGGSLRDTVDCLNRAKTILSDDIFMKVTGCLGEALDSSDAGDVILISDGEHRTRGAGGLEEGGNLIGIGDLEKTIICPEETKSGPSLFDFSGDQVSLENVCLNLDELEAGILVRRGTVRLTGCKIFVANKSVVKLGIVVLPGGKLFAESTIFSGLGTAVVVHSGGEAVLDQCKFKDCVEGVELQDEARLIATKCNMSNLREYGIRIETRKPIERKSGSEALLSNIESVHVIGCSFENIGKGNVTLRPQLNASFIPKRDCSDPDM